MHTHPNCTCHIRNQFSGTPNSLSEMGDASVVTLLGYDNIYLISPDGDLYKYSGVGNDNKKTLENTKAEIEELDVYATGLPKLSETPYNTSNSPN